jgi:DNA polymerase-3 subunit gamma/tau
MFYLKYRPKTIKDLDNSNVKEVITNILKSGSKNNNLPHALLFTGQKGTGKTSTARIIAKAVNCLNNAFAGKGDSIEPCNECVNCKSIETSSSPDIIEMDAASNRGIDEIRTLIRESSFSPISARYRVFIIDEAHMITNDAFNALLKTLEEPPAAVIFILATTNEEKVPKTIISRCTRVSFGKAKKTDILQRLNKIIEEEKVIIDPAILEFIAGHSESSFRDANKILEELITQNKITLKEAQDYIGLYSNQNFLEILSTKPLKDALQWVNDFSQNGGSVKYLLEETLEKLRVALLVKSGVQIDVEAETNLSIGTIATLMKLLNEAYGNLKISPIESVPLEIAVVEFYNSKK